MSKCWTFEGIFFDIFSVSTLFIGLLLKSCSMLPAVSPFVSTCRVEMILSRPRCTSPGLFSCSQSRFFPSTWNLTGGAPLLYLHIHSSQSVSPLFCLFVPVPPPCQDLTFFPPGSQRVLAGAFVTRCLWTSLSLRLLCLFFPSTLRTPSLTPSPPVRLCVCLAKQLAACVICFLWQLSELSLRACCSAEVEHLHQK